VRARIEGCGYTVAEVRALVQGGHCRAGARPDQPSALYLLALGGGGLQNSRAGARRSQLGNPLSPSSSRSAGV